VSKRSRRSEPEGIVANAASTLLLPPPPPPSLPPAAAPQRVRRLLPLHSKNADPKDCLDRIDDIYQHYYDLEVREHPVHCCAFASLKSFTIQAHLPFPLLHTQ
jgi:hypothetical protein